MVIKVAILQSNYLPWTGVFELINSVDKFVFFDDVQYTNRDWRTRNLIKTNQGKLWLSVPVYKQKRDTNIIDIKICNEINWKRKHYKSFCHHYSRSKYFSQYKHLLDFYLLDWEYLHKLNRYTTEKISRTLGIDTEFYYSENFKVSGNASEKIIQVVDQLGGDTYVSGKAGRNYIDESLFSDIKLEYVEYKTENKFTVLDNIFNSGIDIL